VATRVEPQSGHFGWSGTRRTFVVRFQSAQWGQKRMTRSFRMRSRIVSITSASAFSGTRNSVPDDRPAIPSGVRSRAIADRSTRPASSNSSAVSPTARSAWGYLARLVVDGRSLQRREQAVTAEPASPLAVALDRTELRGDLRERELERRSFKASSRYASNRSGSVVSNTSRKVPGPTP